MSHFLKIITALDQLGTAIANGNIDCTISATVGHFNKIMPHSVYWDNMRWMIDTTFYPVDGIGHCEQARANDPNEYYEEGIRWVLAGLAGFFCVFIAIILWGRFLFLKIRNK